MLKKHALFNNDNQVLNRINNQLGNPERLKGYKLLSQRHGLVVVASEWSQCVTW